MTFFSLRWKLALTLSLVTMGVVAVYIGIAKATFETDKVSYIFDFQQIQLNSAAIVIEQQFERVAWDARAVTATYDSNTKALNPMGQELFSSHLNLRSVELWDPLQKAQILHLEKEAVRLPSSTVEMPTDTITVHAESAERFLIHTTIPSDRGPLVLRVQADFPDLLPVDVKGGDFLLFQDGHLIAATNNVSQAETLPEKFGGFHASATAVRTLGKTRYLASVKPLSYPGLTLVELMPEAEALAALQTLYRRSVAFAVFSALGVILLAWLLSQSLTGNLRALVGNAEQIGRGQFGKLREVFSNDEVGIVGSAFKKMSNEIQRLLSETRDKARMEAELQTARLVQESLLPAQGVQSFGEIRLAGQSVSSTECGGDWWYAYQRGTKLYVIVADATGHGTGSALITSATRSIFSLIETQDLTLPQIAQMWDRAIASCSHGKVLMTGYILKLDVVTGEGEALCASHEMAIKWVSGEKGFQPDHVLTEASWILGEQRDPASWKTTPVRLRPGEVLLLYSDGLWSVEDKAGQIISEGRVMRLITGLLKGRTQAEPEWLVQQIVSKLNELRADRPLPDDLTAVVLTRRSA